MTNTAPPRKPLPTKPATRPTQTLSTGKAVDHDVLARLGGFSRVRMSAGPLAGIVVLCSKSGHGKSVFAHSCEDGFVFNADCSTTPRTVRAIVWPGVDRNKRPVEFSPEFPNDPDRGITVDDVENGGGLTYELCLKKQRILLEMARENHPGRPKIVFIDTLDTFYKMVQDSMLREFNAVNPDNPKRTFRHLEGRTAWPESYKIVLNFIMELHRAGYGICLNCLLADRTIYEDGDRVRTFNEPQIQSGVWDTIIAHAELVAALQLRDRHYTKAIPVLDPTTKQPKKRANGLVETKTIQLKETVCWMSVTPTVQASCKKRLFAMPDEFPLPRDRSFDEYARQVRLALEQEDTNTSVPASTTA